MPFTLNPLLAGTNGVPITDAQGVPTIFFLLRWNQLQALAAQTPTVINPGASAVQTAALPTTILYTVPPGNGGQFGISWSLQRTAIDGVASSLQATIGWTQSGVAKTHVGRLMNTDSLAADPTDSPIMITADAASDITLSIAYASTTPGAMKYTYTPVVQRFA